MKKMMAIFLMMSLMSVSCSKSGGGSSSEQATTTPSTVADASSNTDTDSNTNMPPNSDPTPDTSNDDDSTPAPVTNVPALALSFSTNVELIDFTDAQATKYNQAVEIVKLVVATEEFKNRVLNFTYNGSKTFADNKGKTNEQIYQSILDAAETLQPAKNNQMDLEVELYYTFTNTVGYTTSRSPRIWVNTKYFNTYAASSVAGNLFHEWLHKLGYSHDASATAKRPYTVPYGIGTIMSQLGKKFL